MQKSVPSDPLRSVRVAERLGVIPAHPDIAVRVQSVAGKGRGVVAVNRIPKGAVVCCDAVERYTGEEARALRDHPLYWHLFVDPSTYGREASCDLLWVIGAISLVNHSDDPNSSMRFTATSAGEWAVLYANREIQPGEEILISYTNIEEYADYQLFE